MGRFLNLWLPNHICTGLARVGTQSCNSLWYSNGRPNGGVTITPETTKLCPKLGDDMAGHGWWIDFLMPGFDTRRAVTAHSKQSEVSEEASS